MTCNEGLTVWQLFLSLERETIVVSDFPLCDSHKEEEILESRDSDWSNLTFKHDLTLLNIDTSTDHLLHRR
jgi:hypothetical protein